MYLFVVRHAWAGLRGDPTWQKDAHRPLTQEGIVRFCRVVEKLKPCGFSPAYIATSPYARCRETADLIATYSGGRIDELEALEPGSDLEALIAWTRDRQAEESSLGEDVCWVGHNPDLSYLVAALVGEGAAAIRLAKGGVAAVRFEGLVEPGAGQLYWLATAKLLGV